jgi:hypothetical protein
LSRKDTSNDENRLKSTGRVHLHRQRMRGDGFKYICIPITLEHREILRSLCQKMKMSQASVISYLLDYAEERNLPETDDLQIIN